MFDRGKPREASPSSPNKKTAPDQGSHMNNEQFAAYLRDLRNNRVNRPGGARPQPSSPGSRQSSFRQSFDGRPSFASATRSSMSTPPPLSEPSSASTQSYSPPKTATTRDFSRPSIAPSVSSRYSNVSGRGRDYYPTNSVAPLKPGDVVPSTTYIERGQRWMEKEEAVALRQALEDKDAKELSSGSEDGHLYEAALDEAAELVWQHQHGIKPPEPGTPYRYKPHMRKNSYAHARTASAGLYGDEIEPTGLARNCPSRSVSGSSASSDGFGTARSRGSFVSSVAGSRKAPSPPGKGRSVSPKSSKPYTGLTGSSRSTTSSQRRRSSMKRNNTGDRPFSGDQIWEEPEGISAEGSSSPERNSAEALRTKPTSPLNRVSFATGNKPVTSSDSLTQSPKLHKYEIYRNPPTQSRNPQYTTNSRPQTPVSRDDIPKKHGMEVRSDDIRQATSMTLKDRSPKLPTPSAVSDRPGRPIVSFDRNWKAPDQATDDKPDTREGAFRGRQDSPRRRLPEIPSIPSIAITETRQPQTSSNLRSLPTPAIQVDAPRGSPSPSIPSIAVTADQPSIPSIVLPGDDDGPSIPVIVTPDDSTGKPTSRPLPTPQKNAPRVRPGRPRGHWSPAPTSQIGNRATARCHECNYPIEGRFIALANKDVRLHPHCFACYTCGTSLEALEISPEPDQHRAARLERIQRRAAGEVLEEKPGETMAEDGDDRLRFYCHLDWHELFAPRCKHCTTPILGEHIVALGEHWHYGHFFCAECGDPFEQGMTHIEKDGYAWCVNCQTKRTERRAPKCKMCHKAVIGQYIRALGGEWHDECFRCATCNGGFDDGQIFPTENRSGRMVVLCTGCRERELKG